MLGWGTAIWLFEMLVVLDWRWSRAEAFVQSPKEWLLFIVLNILAAVWFGALWVKALRWRQRRSVRVAPEVRAERERIAQDLHDGVGSHLARALALLDTDKVATEEVRQAVEYAMFTLRVEMEALDDADASLVERLASMRWRLQPLLAQRGMRMRWNMPLDEVDESPRGDAGMQLALLAQEAMSNALQHSGGKLLDVSLHVQDALWVLEVADDGCGMPPDGVPAGHCPVQQAHRGWGLEGMRSRALRLGARFELLCAPGQGVRIRVLMPVLAAADTGLQVHAEH